ncbi:uncharacterized protein EV422DRAFT_505301 [Fimicolochytrium jonesii]|uniref:uncharacterized protein n=1 Tax=Fimicolochytrium jonesii TaxID=1396493 RepID=UPI0022FE0E96|nr:uncharacterized protein EV422DRAFT_505301 [Fimicolochytrium jonesii]KAI8822471.1 hypothetical protein EV422DRAFT_505301 [Fimicolochytrium jonesii]
MLLWRRTRSVVERVWLSAFQLLDALLGCVWNGGSWRRAWGKWAKATRPTGNFMSEMPRATSRESSVQTQVQTPWIRIACKSWQAAPLKLLYSTAHIQNKPQLHSLCLTLRKNPERYFWIKDFDMGDKFKSSETNKPESRIEWEPLIAPKCRNCYQLLLELDNEDADRPENGTQFYGFGYGSGCLFYIAAKLIGDGEISGTLPYFPGLRVMLISSSSVFEFGGFLKASSCLTCTLTILTCHYRGGRSEQHAHTQIAPMSLSDDLSCNLAERSWIDGFADSNGGGILEIMYTNIRHVEHYDESIRMYEMQALRSKKFDEVRRIRIRDENDRLLQMSSLSEPGAE